MDPFSEENIILKDLQELYNKEQKKSQEIKKFKVKTEKNMKKAYVFQIFFDYNIIDNFGTIFSK